MLTYCCAIKTKAELDLVVTFVVPVHCFTCKLQRCEWHVKSECVERGSNLIVAN